MLHKERDKTEIDRQFTIIEQVAENLKGWTARKKECETWDSVTIQLTDGVRFIDCEYSPRKYPKRWVFSAGEWVAGRRRVSPSDLRSYDGERYNAITCTEKKTPAQLASDLERRFLPGFLATYQACLEHLANENASHKTRQALAEKILSITGGEISHDDDGCEIGLRFPKRVEDLTGYGTARVYESSVILGYNRISMSEGRAVRLLETMCGLDDSE